MSSSVISITLSPAIDRVANVKSLNVGDKNKIISYTERCGGKGINIADVINQFGFHAIASGLVGEKSAAMFKQSLLERNISYSFCTVTGKTRLNIKIIDENNVETRVNFPSFACSEADINLVLQLVLSHHDVPIVTIGGSLPESLSDDTYHDMIVKLNDAGKKVAVDASKQALLKAIEAKPWLIKPNNIELEEIAGKKLHNIKDYVKIAKEIVNQGVEHVVVSLGEKGGVFVGSDYAVLSTPPKMNVVSNIGAGDTLIATWIVGWLRKYPPEQIAQLAIATSAISVTHPGVGFLDEKELADLQKKVTLKHL